MNRLLTAVLFAAAYAQEEEEDEGAMDGIGNWFSSEQEHALFDSITTGDPYTLTGKYGGYKKVGVSFAFISQTVGGAEIPDGGMVLTWAQIPDPETPGNVEGFYCAVKHQRSEETGENVDVETFEGTNIDFASMTGDPDLWCPEAENDETAPSGCKRHSVA